MRLTCLLLAALTVVLVLPAGARAKVDVEFDKAFNFSAVKTWAWNPGEPGQLRMARTADDDPDAMKARSEPWILSAVATEMAQRGLTQASASPDVTATYYLLLSTSMNTQVMGQFVPATVQWSVPPFLASTQALKVMNAGSLVLDLSAGGKVVWRGVASANIKMDINDGKRESLVREAVKDLLKRFPPKP